MYEICIRCVSAPAVDENGYCGHCHWISRVEVEVGIDQIHEYLGNWARFDAWCEEHRAAA
jgi:hypothetical protein